MDSTYSNDVSQQNISLILQQLAAIVNQTPTQQPNLNAPLPIAVPFQQQYYPQPSQQPWIQTYGQPYQLPVSVPVPVPVPVSVPAPLQLPLPQHSIPSVAQTSVPLPTFLESIQKLEQIAQEARTFVPEKPKEAAPPPRPRSVANTTTAATTNSATTTAGLPANAILEWAPALRHITHLGAKNPHVEVAVKKLIRDQCENEYSWWKGHENLRKEILSGNGNMQDLEAYDSKVYKAQKDMYIHHEQRLRELGVPFFGVPQKYIAAANDDKPYGKIAPQELVSLQKRMVQHLQDMYQ